MKTLKKKAKDNCKKYGLAITNYVLGEEMDIGREELFQHLRTCQKCRQDLFDWEDTHLVMRTEAHFAKPETKQKYAELLERIKGKETAKVPIDVRREVGSAARRLYDLLKTNGEMSISLIKEKTGLKEYHIQQAIGWLGSHEKITLSKDTKTAYVALQPGA